MGKRKNKITTDEPTNVVRETAQPAGEVPPEGAPVEESVSQSTMTLVSYCNALGFDGINKFAFSRITAHCKENNIGLEAKPSSEWEKIYIGIQNS